MGQRGAAWFSSDEKVLVRLLAGNFSGLSVATLLFTGRPDMF
jgi:hypothetical protein